MDHTSVFLIIKKWAKKWIFENQGEEETYFYQTLTQTTTLQEPHTSTKLWPCFYNWALLENWFQRTHESPNKKFQKTCQPKHSSSRTRERRVLPLKPLCRKGMPSSLKNLLMVMIREKWLKICLERTNEERRSLQILHQTWYLGWALGPIREFSLSITMLFVFLRHTFIFNNLW